MGKVKAPKFHESMDLDKWTKLLKSWVRSLPANSTNDEIVSAVVMGLPDPSSKPDALDLVLDIDENKLYPTEVVAVDRSNVNSFPGLKEILEVFKQKYGESEEEKAFQRYETFESLKRDSKTNMKDYIIQFEAAYKKIEDCGITLSDIVLAYRLLKSACLGDDEKLVRTSVASMTLVEMKKTLLKFSDGVVCHSPTNLKATPRVQIKSEPLDILYHDQGEYEETEFENTYEDSPYNINAPEDQHFSQNRQCEDEIYYNRAPHFNRSNRGNSHY